VEILSQEVTMLMAMAVLVLVKVVYSVGCQWVLERWQVIVIVMMIETRMMMVTANQHPHSN
jgi:hypothetical protein